jgi:hypothetical protein
MGWVRGQRCALKLILYVEARTTLDLGCFLHGPRVPVLDEPIAAGGGDEVAGSVVAALETRDFVVHVADSAVW